jgi:hypothetical protein
MEDMIQKFSESLEKLNNGLAMNILRLQLQAMETALKNTQPEVYKEYISAFNKLMITDEAYLSLVNSLNEAKATIDLLAASADKARDSSDN